VGGKAALGVSILAGARFIGIALRRDEANLNNFQPIRQIVGDNGNRLTAGVISAMTPLCSPRKREREWRQALSRNKEGERRSALNRRTYTSRISFFFFLFWRCSAAFAFAFAREICPQVDVPLSESSFQSPLRLP